MVRLAYLRWMGNYVNLDAGRIQLLRRCVAEQLWIRTNRRWFGPYDWAREFSSTFFGLDWEPTLANPRELIAKARQDIECGKPLTFPSQNGPKAITQEEVPLDRAILAIKNFEARVDAYYNSEKDALLLKSIDTGLWHF